jgi:hypothetical protein
MSEDESIIPKPREPFSDAVLPQNADELALFMDQPLAAIAETITGALAAGPKVWTVMTGHIVQGMLKGKLFQQVSKEIKELRDKGKIPDDFADEKKYKYGFKSWVELLTVIDEETPDADRLEALKAMFFAVNRTNAADGERIVAYQLFQIAKKLTSGELLLLKVIHETYKAGGLPRTPLSTAASNWRSQMANRLGHGLSALVEQNERALAEYSLIMPIVMSGQLQTIRDDENARLSDLGIRFCKNIETYNAETSSD